MDGRSVYLDFFGLVLWDFVPTATSGDIKQIEVVRGPASVVWGANALTGVVNVITKSPREHEGFGLNLSAGLFNRDGGSREADGTGYQYSGSFSFAKRPQRHLVLQADRRLLQLRPLLAPRGHRAPGLPSARPQPLPRRAGPARSRARSPTGGAAYPSETDTTGNFINNGTSQPKVDLRVDQDVNGNGRITYQGGYAGTTGIVHTGIGPFDIQSGSYLTYGKVRLHARAPARSGRSGTSWTPTRRTCCRSTPTP